MVAMAILAMSLVAVFDVVGGALRNHERARALELATLLARSKLVEVEAKFEEDGFKDFDQEEDGTFEAEGHPEVHWVASAQKPTIEPGEAGVVRALTGVDGGLDGLLAKLTGAPPPGQGTGPTEPTTAASPLAGPMGALVKQQLVGLGEQIKGGVRRLRLTVSWPEGQRTESFSVVTYLVVLAPGATAPVAAPVAATPTGPPAPPSTGGN
jgi:general secretion pathway protein I